MMNVASYMKRIGYNGTCEPTWKTLQQIHKQHLLSVPFETISIHCGERITLDLQLLYNKIVLQHRGGFCFELNGLFSWLLRELGFQVIQISGQVRNRFTKRYGRPNDHLILLVELDGQKWLCDVGFGEGFRSPFLLRSNEKQVEHGSFRLFQDGDTCYLEKLPKPLALGNGDAIWTTIYKFTLASHHLEDFRAMCNYHQTSQSSIMVCKSFCTLHLPNGMITYIGRKLIVTQCAGEFCTKIQSELEESEIPKILQERFGITLTNLFIPKDMNIVPPPVEW
ncbi:arylamine N-acetyltransferase, pineal gland isozyme NAT-3-like [Protopterus annectens]|uniref:arylamine N-acetyltransferase, pineal gland isozyme NAT-3-like n=1 Tax=Protopterus annectens TaxID=7888 RepID=UPI001CFB470D|nr:arylamine N-acetyltransferase, pineal gland isozyme NAT-3-like [Protopterus annectens]